MGCVVGDFEQINSKDMEAWVARDSNGCIGLYFEKPEKMSCEDGDGGWWGECAYLFDDDDPKFSNVKWEDDEPTYYMLTLEEIN